MGEITIEQSLNQIPVNKPIAFDRGWDGGGVFSLAVSYLIVRLAVCGPCVVLKGL